METRELQVVNIDDQAMTPENIQNHVNIVQRVMRQVMKEGEHYGKIPGCGDKPTLLKPGAEKLSVAFRFAPSYEIRRTDLPGGHREYEVICSLVHFTSGMMIGQGVGSCSTMESKYRYRNAAQTCPECGKEGTVIKGKKDFGGGWLCFGKKGGCGAKFKDGDERIESQAAGRVENDNPADNFNTVLKMAKKRAHVDAILTATGASDIFTQDIEDMEFLHSAPSQPKETDKGKPESGNGKPKTQGKKTGAPPGKGPRELMFDALKSAGLTNQDMVGLANFYKGDESRLNAAAMKSIAEDPAWHIARWRMVETLKKQGLSIDEIGRLEQYLSGGSASPLEETQNMMAAVSDPTEYIDSWKSFEAENQSPFGN